MGLSDIIPERVHRARNGLFKPEKIQLILDGRAKLMSTARCAQLAGCTTRCIEYWLNRGRTELEYWEDSYDDDFPEDLPPYADFFVKWGMAQAKTIKAFTETMINSANQSTREWTALMTLMERRLNEDYGQKTQVAVQQKVESTITFKIVDGDEWKPSVSDKKVTMIEDGNTFDTNYVDEVTKLDG